MDKLVDIKIKNFIFHVVHHGEDEPILMDNTPIDGFEIFFKDRITEVLEGNRFNFLQDSTFLESIKSIDKNSKKFVDISKDLARDFHKHQNGRIKPGVMILVKVEVDQKKKYILIKYDHESVITYKTKNKNAVLEEISNTFSKNREALQKSAIIDLNDSVVGAIIIDKSERGNVTDFFKGFLGIKRFYSNEELTLKLSSCFLDTIKEHKTTLPSDFTSQASIIFYDLVQNSKTFKGQDTVKELFGVHYNENIERTFNRKLKQADISGEEFNYDKKIKKPKKKKYRTQEGVIIQYDTIAEDTIDIKIGEDETTITITTKKLTEENANSK